MAASAYPQLVPSLAGRIVRRSPEDVRDAQLTALAQEVARRTAEWHPHAALLTRGLAAAAASGCSTRPVLVQLEIPPSSILSRFTRAGLPSPKTQSLLFRLWLGIAVRHGGAAHGDVGHLLNWSSPQAFARAIRMHMGCSPSELFARTTPEAFWRERIDPVMSWSDDRWVSFDPVDGSRYDVRQYAARAARAVRFQAQGVA